MFAVVFCTSIAWKLCFKDHNRAIQFALVSHLDIIDNEIVEFLNEDTASVHIAQYLRCFHKFSRAFPGIF